MGEWKFKYRPEQNKIKLIDIYLQKYGLQEVNVISK